ncbi:zinc-binding dehydrogenase [Streptomyces sp. NPDC058695]|uniref:zinc-binding dehydrogenase n=1 Tax=Streptomyces sp. NPDC058695 TaxID=3346604 RepID=UPI00365B5749
MEAVSAPVSLPEYLGTLRLHGTMVNVGVTTEAMPMEVFTLLQNGRSFVGSLFGGIAETHEMLDLAAEHSVTADIELIDAQDVNTAYERILASDVRYRFRDRRCDLCEAEAGMTNHHVVAVRGRQVAIPEEALVRGVLVLRSRSWAGRCAPRSSALPGRRRDAPGDPQGAAGGGRARVGEQGRPGGSAQGRARACGQRLDDLGVCGACVATAGGWPVPQQLCALAAVLDAVCWASDHLRC